jgi:hypothetical protein
MNFRKKIKKVYNNSLVKMERVDDKEIPEDKEEVRLFVVGIDLAYLIPHFLKHYFNLGVDRIFYIDNDSSDNSLDVLGQYDNVHVWSQKEEFSSAESKGRRWREYLLSKYGVGNWCLVPDVDEFFIYPGCEDKSIKDFVKEQDEAGYDCVKSRFIDMYSNKKVKDTMIIGSILETCPYFDNSKYGCKHRVLGLKPYFNKMVLFRYREETIIVTGNHDIVGYNKLSNTLCGILHLKFVSNFLPWNDKHCAKFKCVKARLDRPWGELYSELGDINFYDKDISVKYSGSKDIDIFKKWN